MPKVSVIVPVYGVEKYVSKCIESVLNQTYSGWELILVDDGSPDRSGAICDEYAQKDCRIKVIHKENGGVSSARNVGLDNAKGDWVTFIDGDDWIDKQCLEVCLETVRNEHVDLAQFNYRMIDEKGNITPTPIKEALAMESKKYIERGTFNVCVGGALIAHSLIQEHKIRFPEGIKLAEDQIFIMRCIAHSYRIVFLRDVFYNYLQLETSAVHTSKTGDILKSLNILEEFKHDYPMFTPHIAEQNNKFCYQLVLSKEMSIKKICELYDNEEEGTTSLRTKLLKYPSIRRLLYALTRYWHCLTK